MQKVQRVCSASTKKAAAEGDFASFRQGVPKSMDDKAAKELYKTLRAAMQIKEGWSLKIAPGFDWMNLRENFIKKKVYKVGDIVENDNTGLIGKIIRRGTSYLICVTEDNIMFKSWIKDVSEAITNSNAPSGVLMIRD